MLRIVTPPASALMRISHSASPHQGTQTKPERSLKCATTSASVDISKVLALRKSWARANNAFWNAASSSTSLFAMPVTGTDRLCRVKRSTSSTWPASASRAPTFSRSGTPFISQCAYLSPGLSSRQSTRLRIPAAFSSPAHPPMNASTLARLSASRKIGTITTWIGATFGGTNRPESSPWAITRAPTSRVLMPHEVE